MILTAALPSSAYATAALVGLERGFVQMMRFKLRLLLVGLRHLCSSRHGLWRQGLSASPGPGSRPGPPAGGLCQTGSGLA